MRSFYAIPLAFLVCCFLNCALANSDLGLDSWTQSIVSTNTTVISSPLPTAKDIYQVTAVIGKQKTNVGDLRTNALYHEIYWALDKACKSGSSGCDWAVTATIPINFLSNGQPSQTLMEVRAVGEYRNEKIRRLFIGSIAGMIEVMVSDLQNCYKVSNGHYCNIADSVSIGLIARNDQIHAKFWSPRGNGKFDCAAIKEVAHKKLDHYKDEYKDALGPPKAPQDLVVTDVKCVS